MAVAIVASIVERRHHLRQGFLGRFWALIFPSNRFAGDVRPLRVARARRREQILPILKEASMRNKILIILGVLVVMGAIAGGIVYANLDTAIKLASMAVNYIKYLNAPAGTTVTELAAGLQRRRDVGAARRPPRRVLPNSRR